MVGLRGEQTAIELPAVGQRRIVADAAGEHGRAVSLRVGGQRLVVDPYRRVLDAIAHQADGHVAVIEVCVHHIGTGSTVLALAVHHHAEQLAASLLLIVIEHLQREEVVGGGANVGVEDNQRHARVRLCGSRIVVVICRAPRQNDGTKQGKDEVTKQREPPSLHHKYHIFSNLIVQHTEKVFNIF